MAWKSVYDCREREWEKDDAGNAISVKSAARKSDRVRRPYAEYISSLKCSVDSRTIVVASTMSPKSLQVIDFAMPVQSLALLILHRLLFVFFIAKSEKLSIVVTVLPYHSFSCSSLCCFSAKLEDMTLVFLIIFCHNSNAAFTWYWAAVSCM